MKRSELKRLRFGGEKKVLERRKKSLEKNSSSTSEFLKVKQKLDQTCFFRLEFFIEWWEEKECFFAGILKTVFVGLLRFFGLMLLESRNFIVLNNWIILG